MNRETIQAAPPLPPRPRPRPLPPPHAAQTVGQQPRMIPGTGGTVENPQAAINAIKTKVEKYGPMEQNKENHSVPLETVVELLEIKERMSARDVKEFRDDVGIARRDSPIRRPLPETPMRVGENVGARSITGGLLELEGRQELGSMIARLDECAKISGNGLIVKQAPPPLPLRTGCTYNAVTRIHSGKYRGNQLRVDRPLPEIPMQKQPNIGTDRSGYVIDSNSEYLEAVASQYHQSYGKMAKTFIKVHGIDRLALPNECDGDGEGNADRYVYLVLECDGRTVSSKRVAADSGRVRICEEFAFSVRAGCNLNVQLVLVPHPPLHRSSNFGLSTSAATLNHQGYSTDQYSTGKVSGDISISSSTRNHSSEIESSGYSTPRIKTSASSIFFAGEVLGETGLTLDSGALANLSTPKSTAGFHLCWELKRQFSEPQEQAKPTSHEQKNASHALRKQWQRLKKRSSISSSISLGTINDKEEVVPRTRNIVVIGNVKASAVVWPYAGEREPSGFDECVRILTCDSVSNLNRMVKGWAEHGKEWIVQNPEVNLSCVLEAATVLGNLTVLGNASVRVADSLFWKRRSFTIHPPHLLSLPISDQNPTHLHRTFDLRLCTKIEAPFETPIQDVQDGLWHPTTNAFRIFFRKSAEEEEEVELSVDSLTTAKEWVKILRDVVRRLQ